LQILQRPRHGDTRDDDRPWRDRTNVVLPRMPAGMADDSRRDQGCRAAPGALQPLGESRPAASFEFWLAGTLFAPAHDGSGPARTAVSPNQTLASENVGVMTRLAGRRPDGRPSSRDFRRTIRRSNSTPLRRSIDRLRRPARQVPSHGRARIQTHYDECNIELARAHHVARWRAALRAVDVVGRP
jgi:hypothetical protein